MKKMSAGILTALLVMIAMWAWTSRTVSAQHAPPAGSAGSWHKQLHAEFMAMLPHSVQAHLQHWHGSH